MSLHVVGRARRQMASVGVGAAAAAALLAATTDAARADAALADLVEQVSPAVVTVLSTDTDPMNTSMNDRFGSPDGSPFEEFFRRYGRPDQMPGPFDRKGPRRGLGSGFILNSDGYIVTNHHVIDKADEVTVRLSDRRQFEAEVVGTDPQTDLALLRIEAEGELPSVTLGDSDKMRVGEDVFAVGNPFGLGGTVTTGIVSATGRNIQAGPYADFIQTDAAINRGNSGGPLFNMDGEVIGVNSAIYSPTGGSVGVGFAVASNIVSQVIADLKDDGSVSRGWLGVSIQDVTPEIAEAIDLDEPRGALVATVLDDGPSAGKLEAGDVIVDFAGKPVRSSRDLPKLVAQAQAGETVDVTTLRNGERKTVEVEIGELPTKRVAMADGGDSDPKGSASEALGATLAKLTPEARDNLGLGEDVSGVVITSVNARGAAAKAGLEVGDVIVRLGDQQVTSPKALDRAIADQDGDAALLMVNRRGSEIFVGVRLA